MGLQLPESFTDPAKKGETGMLVKARMGSYGANIARWNRPMVLLLDNGVPYWLSWTPDRLQRVMCADLIGPCRAWRNFSAEWRCRARDRAEGVREPLRAHLKEPRRWPFHQGGRPPPRLAASKWRRRRGKGKSLEPPSGAKPKHPPLAAQAATAVTMECADPRGAFIRVRRERTRQIISISARTDMGALTSP